MEKEYKICFVLYMIALGINGYAIFNNMTGGNLWTIPLSIAVNIYFFIFLIYQSSINEAILKTKRYYKIYSKITDKYLMLAALILVDWAIYNTSDIEIVKGILLSLSCLLTFLLFPKMVFVKASKVQAQV